MLSFFLKYTSLQLSPGWHLIVQDSALVLHTGIDSLPLCFQGLSPLATTSYLVIVCVLIFLPQHELPMGRDWVFFDICISDTQHSEDSVNV